MREESEGRVITEPSHPAKASSNLFHNEDNNGKKQSTAIRISSSGSGSSSAVI
jgi:hypothetical protein